VSDQDIELSQPFGGPWGALAIMVFSHTILYYLYLCNFMNNGALLYPQNLCDFVPFFQRSFYYILENASPTKESFLVYGSFIVL
jgi:delta24(24(1))-sterol reductase